MILYDMNEGIRGLVCLRYIFAASMPVLRHTQVVMRTGGTLLAKRVKRNHGVLLTEAC